jgi:hypothetical protein
METLVLSNLCVGVVLVFAFEFLAVLKQARQPVQVAQPAGPWSRYAHHETARGGERARAVLEALEEMATRSRVSSDAKDLLGWGGNPLSTEELRRLREKALSYWHPDKRAAFVSATGRAERAFDATSNRVLDALKWLEAQPRAPDVVGWDVVGW